VKSIDFRNTNCIETERKNGDNGSGMFRSLSENKIKSQKISAFEVRN
jgi:hypothetical protein